MTNRRTLQSTLWVGVFGLGCAAGINQQTLDSQLESMRQELRAEMESGDDQVESNANRFTVRHVDSVSMEVNTLEQELAALRADWEETERRVMSAVRYDAPVHFDFDDATLKNTASLDRFAAAVATHYPEAIITVEGFTDPAGSETYNRELGLRRAEAVRTYLADSTNLAAERIRAVSYGESPERLVEPHAFGPGLTGEANRRVTLVVEHAATPMFTRR